MAKVTKVDSIKKSKSLTIENFPHGSVFDYYGSLYMIMRWDDNKLRADTYSFRRNEVVEFFGDLNEVFIPATIEEVKYSV